MARRDFRTPASIPVETTGRCIVVPNSADWLGLLNAALLMLAQSWRYTQVEATDLTPEETANAWYAIYVQSLLSDCEGGMFDVRQNGLMPCILEKQSGEEGWVPFADLSLCSSPLAPTVYDPVTGELEYASTGTSARNIDTRFVGTKTPLASGIDCADAKAIVGYMQTIVDETLTQIDLGTGVVGITAALVTVLATVFSFGALAPIAVGFAAALTGLTRVAIEAAMTTTVWTNLLCNIYCFTEGATDVTADAYDSIVAANEETGIAYTMVNHLLWQLGPVGLQNAIALGIAPDATVNAYDCASCACGTFTHAWLGGEGWDTWDILPWNIGGTIGCTATYDAVLDEITGCQGSKDWGSPAMWRIGSSIKVEFDQRHITSYRVSWDGGGNYSGTIFKCLTRFYKAGVLVHERYDYTRVRDITVPVSVDADQMDIYVRDATSVSTARTHLKRIEISGNGIDPF